MHLALPGSNIHKLYLANTLFSFAYAFFTLFIGILIIQKLYWLDLHVAVTIAALGYAAKYLTRLAFIPLISILSEKWGLRTMYIVGLSLNALTLILFKQEYYISGLVVMGLGNDFYWYPFYFTMLEAKDDHQRDSGLGNLMGLERLVTVVAPLISAWLISIGSNQFFTIALGFMFLAIIVAFKMPNHKASGPLHFDHLKFIFKKYKRDAIGTIGYSIENITQLVSWPIILYLTLNNVWDVAIIYATAMVVSAVIDFTLGRKLDDRLTEKIQHSSGIFVCLIWFSRALLRSAFTLGISQVIYIILIGIRDLPYMSTILDHASHEYQAAYITFRQATHVTGMLIGILIFAVIAYFQLPYWYIFIVAGTSSLAVSVMKS